MSNIALIDQATLLKTAEIISKSDIVPQAYQGKPGNVFLVLELAKRLGMDSLTMLNNVDVIRGKPSFKSSFLIAMANSSGMLSERITFNTTGKELKDSPDCMKVTASAVLKDGKRIEYTVGFDMAIKEGWASKTGSKYYSMPELMLSYRAATFLCRLYLPEIGSMMYTKEEIEDIHAEKPKQEQSKDQHNVIDVQFKKEDDTKKTTHQIQQENAQKSKEEFDIVKDFNSKAENMKQIIDNLCVENVGKMTIDEDFKNSFKDEFFQYFKDEYIKNNGKVGLTNLFNVKLTAKRLTVLAYKHNAGVDNPLDEKQLNDLKKKAFNKYMEDQTQDLVTVFINEAHDYVRF